MNLTKEILHKKLLHTIHSEKLRYLLDRGLNLETIKRFEIGYIDKNNKPHNRTYFDFRIMIPIIDRHRKHVGYSGRTINDIGEKYISPVERKLLDRKRLEPSKYLNTITYKDFNKGAMLFNELSIIKGVTKTVILVESQLDVIALEQNRSIVDEMYTDYAICGIQGTSLTQFHINYLLSCGVGEIIVMLDNDKAGVEATKKALVLLARNGLPSIYACFMPKGKDAMDIIREPREITRSLSRRYTFLDFLGHYYNKHYPTTERLYELSRDITDINRIISKDKIYYSERKIKRNFNSHIANGATICDII